MGTDYEFRGESMAGVAMTDEVTPPEVRNMQTLGCWIKLWVRNSFENYATIRTSKEREHAHSLCELKDIGRGRAAIVLGAGASLDDYLEGADGDTLRNIGDKAMVLAPNSVALTCLRHKVEPYAFLAMHPTHEVAHGFNLGTAKAPLPMRCKGRRLITATSIHPDVLDGWLHPGDAGDVYMTLQYHSQRLNVVTKEDKEKQELEVSKLESADIPSDWYGNVQSAAWNGPPVSSSHPLHPWQARGLCLPVVPNAGCVVNYAIECAGIMGCSPILLVGVDYAFTPSSTVMWRYKCKRWKVRRPTLTQRLMAQVGMWSAERDGKWYDNTNHARDVQTIMGMALKEAPGVNGGTRYSHEYMVGYRNGTQQLYDKGRDLDNRPLDIVNCGLDGILCGLPRMDLKEALAKVRAGSWHGREVAK